MNKIHAVIIETEVPAARLLHSMIKALRPGWKITLLPGNVEESVKWFGNIRIRICISGYTVIGRRLIHFLSEAKPTSTIIFTTAYDEYAIRAFSVNSIDYILKPVDEKRLLGKQSSNMRR